MFSPLIVALSAVLSFFVVSRALPLDSVARDSNGPFTDGIATWYTQDENPSACGTYHTDDEMICAMDSARYTDSLCGRQVQITNTSNNRTVTVTIADECPTCENGNSIDLSLTAFKRLESDLDVGELPISWVYMS